MYRHHHKLYPVMEQGRVVGCVTVDGVRGVPREAWASRRVADIATPCTPQNTVRPDDDALEALAKMRGSGVSRLLVTSDGRLEGILTLKDLLDFFALKMDLERPAAGR